MSASAASSYTGAAKVGVTGILYPAGAAAEVSGADKRLWLCQRNRRHNQNSQLVFGPEVESITTYRFGSPDMQVQNVVQPLRPVDRHRGNNFRRSPHQYLLGCTVGGGPDQQIPMLRPDPLRVAMRDRREQQKLVGRHLESLLADASFAQQYGLAAVQQRVHRRAPLFERERHRGPTSTSRATASRRRCGGALCDRMVTASAVAAGCRPRSSVMFLHILQR